MVINPALITGVTMAIGMGELYKHKCTIENERHKEIMHELFKEAKISETEPRKNDWVTKISRSEFEHMMADKQCYCDVMTRIANDLNIPYSFYVENGVITFCVDFGGRKNEQ